MTTPKAAGSAFLRVTIKTRDSRLVIDGEWYIPKWGCDSLEASLDALLSILQSDTRPTPPNADVPTSVSAANGENVGAERGACSLPRRKGKTK